MERGGEGPMASRPNGSERPLNQLVVKQEGRKPLFSTASRNDSSSAQPKDLNPQAKPFGERSRIATGTGERFAAARRTNSESHIPPVRRDSTASSTTAPGSTSRIPQPANNPSSHRRGLSIAESWKRAEDEEDPTGGDDREEPPDASPSPAPRAWRSNREQDDNKLRKALAEDPLDAKSRQKQLSKESDKTNTETGPAPANKGSEPNSQSSRTLDGGGPSWRSRVGDWRTRSPANANALDFDKDDLGGSPVIPDLVPGIEDIPLPSVETPGRDRRQPRIPSPEKSFAWQVDEDFTAGDLQVSDSPRIKMGSQPFANRLNFDDTSEVDIHSRTRVNKPGSHNTKLDEIRSREVKAGSNIPVERPLSGPRNTKLDEIRARESEAEKIPIPSRRLSGTQNTKLDEIREREAQGLSKRQSAAARLQEIREQNAMSRSMSPEETRSPANRGAAQELNTINSEKEVKSETASHDKYGINGEQIPNTPVTIFKSRRNLVDDVQGDDKEGQVTNKNPAGAAKPGLSHRRTDSRDLLQRLARATSSSPASETAPRRGGLARKTDKKVGDAPGPALRTARRTPATASTTTGAGRRKGTRLGTGNGNTRPTVGFAGLGNVRLTESAGSKRSSVHSEMDPTDRIEAEMKLFAPQDNYSEKGSVRALSPAPDFKEEDLDGDDVDEDEVEATPKPKKQDPLSMPTPRVTGAYVETPVTVKVDKVEDEKPNSRQHEATKGKAAQALAALRSGSPNASRRTTSLDTASDPGAEESEGASTNRASLVATRRKRSTSLPRARPPLKNSARLPSVKDDLLELQRLNNIDDSTVDDIEEFLAGRKPASPDLNALLQSLSSATDDEDDEDDIDEDFTVPEESNAEIAPEDQSIIKSSEMRQRRVSAPGDLAAFDRMSKSLQTGLLGIRSAKQGIERLEGNLLHSTWHHQAMTLDATKNAGHPHPHDHHSQLSQPCPVCASQATTPISRFLMPLLAYDKSRKRHPLFAVLSFIALVSSVWAFLEFGMCSMYCRPKTCVSPPCVWSYDDPTFGVALPVKMDEWATGGAGRVLFNDVAEEVEDWIADALDVVLGREITAVDMNRLSFEGKRAHRRRLKKKGLDNGLRLEDAPADVRARWDAWHRERVAREQAQDARAMGYSVPSSGGDDGAIGDDERIW